MGIGNLKLWSGLTRHITLTYEDTIMTSIHNPLINLAVSANPIILAERTVKATTSTVKDDIKVRNKWRHLAEFYYADGIREEHLIKTGDKESNPNKALHFQIESAIIAGYDDSVQALLVKDPSTLDQVSKSVRSQWLVKETGSLFNKIRRHVIKIDEERKAEAEAKLKGQPIASNRVTKTPFEKIVDGHADCIRRAKALENPPKGANITRYVELMTQAQSALGIVALEPKTK